ncbi:NAD(P)H-quinone oxidoreductase [Paenibacillus sp. IB182496]|uniref:NAD(P)H-quinone oxidoreductase n=1 Tax=Paenibacillus sabuli TaxID=2772509 RepID=A0A927BVA5_9BACL|nr:NAD(P)H-quinone oxidoreductase [Paenibacillus sabuli]MBD2846310.1 NAD(P)H-quinone oxidoreductase [Paenibacillus sabuli]
MRAIQVEKDTHRLRIGEAPDPEPGPGELLVSIKATAVNRADLLQRIGKYPPPPGASDILGLEMAGVVERAGEGAGPWRLGDRVCALLPGGGYAERAVIPAGMAIAIPERLGFEEAAALPEVFLTAYLNLFRLGRLTAGERVLIHAGASGVGTAAIQLAREAGAVPIVTAGSAAKLDACAALGAVCGINYKEERFADRVLAFTDGHGADVILDPVGAAYWADNDRCIATDGRWVIIGGLGGYRVEQLDIRAFMGRRIQLNFSTLRALPQADKIRLTEQFAGFAAARLGDGRLRPVIDRVFDWTEAEQAHAAMKANANIGKLVLRVQPD